MLGGKAISRVVRGHFFVDAAQLIAYLYNIHLPRVETTSGSSYSDHYRNFQRLFSTQVIHVEQIPGINCDAAEV